MHMKIRIITYGKTRKQAQEQAEAVVKGLCCNGCSDPFDYGSVISTPTLADTKKGKALIDEAMNYQRREFKDSLRQIRAKLATMTDDELFDERDGVGLPARFYMHNAGQYRGSAIWLYDDDGEGIQESHHLENALNKWRCLYEDQGKDNPSADSRVWVSVADVHY